MYYDGKVHIEEDDQCYSCQYVKQGTLCPLLEALAAGVAQLNSDVMVKNCGFYVKFKRHLKLIDVTESTQKPGQVKPKQDPPTTPKGRNTGKQCGGSP